MQLVAHVGHRRLVHHAAILGIDDREEVGLVDAGALVQAGEDTGTPRAWRDAPLAGLVERGGGDCAGSGSLAMRAPGLAAGRAGEAGAYLDDLDQSDDLVARDPVGELGMVAAEMLEREVDELILGLAADDLAALACDLPGHGWVSRAIVGSGPFAYVGGKVGARLERADDTYVQLCGRFVVELRGRRVEQRFPSRQGRVLFAYLVLQRPRAVGRGELIEAIWAGDLPPNRASALTVLLSKLRAAVGADVLGGRGSVYVVLPPDARVDVEQALPLHRAESAVVAGRVGARLERRARARGT